MSSILRTARALLAVIQPRTGSRSTGTATVKATSADVSVPRNSYVVPIVEGQHRPDLVMKVAEGSGECGSWTVTDAGTAVSMFSNIGGRRHNVANGSTLVFDPPIAGIESIVAAGAFTGGDDLAEFGALRDAVFYEHLEGPSKQLDLARSLTKGFPAAVVAWQDSEPADGSTISQTVRETRAGSGKSLYKETFQIAVFSERAESDHVRRAEGLEALDRITTLLVDRQSVDGQPFSNPSGVQIRRRWREMGPQPVYQRFYVYNILLGVMVTLQAEDARTWEDWNTSVIDVVKPQDPELPNQGDYTIVDDMTVDMTS